MRQLERAQRSSLVLLTLSGVGMVLFLACSVGAVVPWCVPQPFLFFVTVVLSSLSGLFLGATIRTIRERRALERDGR